MSIFKRIDLDNYVQRKERRLALLSDFSTRRNTMWKVVIAEYFSQLKSENEPFLRTSTLDEDPVLTTGAPKFSTNVNDVFEVSLVTGAMGIAEDTIWIYNEGDAAWIAVKRMDPDEIEATTEAAFYEINGKLVIYVKKDTLTTPAELQYHYWRSLGATFVDDDSLLDILDKDFTNLADRLASLMLIGTD